MSRSSFDDDEAPTGRLDGQADRITSIPLLPVGEVLDGVYRVEALLGEGGMGMVFLARDVTLERRVAVKVVRPELLERLDVRTRFLEEARALARVQSPHVVQVHAFGEHRGIPYFVMEYVDGATLEEWLATPSKDPQTRLDEAYEHLDQVCRGVEAIHSAHTVHHDLKPSNVLMDQGGRVAVGDLGLSRALRRASSLGGPPPGAGSLAYMAPEMLVEKPVSDELASRADIYSLGIMAYELLTGRLPFATGSTPALMVSHLVEVPAPPSTHNPLLSPAVDAVILRALEKDPAVRTPTAEAFRAELADARNAAPLPPRILLVEDDEDFSTLLAGYLRRVFPGAQVDTTGDGRLALEVVDRHAYDAVVCDLGMPEIDGLTLTALLRARPSSANVPIVVLTGSGGPEEWRQLSSMGADGFLLKPVHLEDVEALLRRVLERPRTSVVVPRPGAGGSAEASA